MKSIVILISGRGSNLDALLAARLPGRVAAVLSNRPDAPGLAIASRLGIHTAVVDHRAFAQREAFDDALRREIDRHEPDLVAAAGFMRVLGTRFVEHYEGRLMNIHPSLLPMFPGLHTHRSALAAGVKLHGCTVHFVTSCLDGGPIIIQAAVPVLDSDTEATLAARVLVQEHRIYPQAVRWFLEGRLHIDGDARVRVDVEQPSQAALIAPPIVPEQVRG